MTEQASSYHNPVMLQQCIEGLQIDPKGIYVDVTFGGGGHSKAILKHLNGGRLIGFDQDDDARLEAEKITSSSFTFCQANFKHLKKYLKLNNVKQVKGILADLGISSHQIDSPERGFSTRFDVAQLDQLAEVGNRLVVSAARLVDNRLNFAHVDHQLKRLELAGIQR